MSENLQVELLNLFIEAGVAVMLEGSPGTAKSAIVEGLCRSLDRHCEVVLSSLREPADFGGLPVPTPDGVILHAPRFAHALAKSSRGLLFLDEITHATPSVQAAIGRVVLSRVVGDCDMGMKTSVVMAGNPASSGGCNPVVEMLNNRVGHISWKLPRAAWRQGALTGFQDPVGFRLPADWEANEPACMARIVSFLDRNPTLMETSDEAAANMAAYPTIRTWTMTARMLAAAASIGHGPRSEIAAALVESLVGEAAAREYTTWVQTQDLADPEEVLANAGSFVLPTRGDRVTTLLDSVVAAALHKGTRTEKDRTARYNACAVVLGRLADAGHKDLVVPSASLLASQKPSFCSIPVAFAKLLPLLQAAGLAGGTK